MSLALKVGFFVCSLVGFVSASHLATILVRERFIRVVDMTKIGTVTVAIIGISAVIHPTRSMFDVWIRIFVPLVTTLLIAFLLAKRRLNRVYRELPNWLGSLIMRMRMGLSLQSAFEEELERNTSATRFQMRSVVRSVSFSPQNNESMPMQIRAIAEEFRRIHLLPSRQLEELERWRERILTSEKFRRRSNQAMAQARAQAVVLGFIYVALIAFTSFAFGWETVKGSLQISVPLFICGAFWLWKGARGVKWTV